MIINHYRFRKMTRRNLRQTNAPSARALPLFGVASVVAGALVYFCIYSYRVGEAMSYGIPTSLVSISLSDLVSMSVPAFCGFLLFLLCAVVFVAAMAMAMAFDTWRHVLLSVAVELLSLLGFFFGAILILACISNDVEAVFKAVASGDPVAIVAFVLTCIWIPLAIGGLPLVLCALENEGRRTVIFETGSRAKRFICRLAVMSFAWLVLLITAIVFAVVVRFDYYWVCFAVFIVTTLLTVLLAKAHVRVNQTVDSVKRTIEESRKNSALTMCLVLLIAVGAFGVCAILFQATGSAFAVHDGSYLVVERQSSNDDIGFNAEDGVGGISRYCALMVFDGNRAIVADCNDDDEDGCFETVVDERHPFKVIDLAGGGYRAYRAECSVEVPDDLRKASGEWR